MWNQIHVKCLYSTLHILTTMTTQPMRDMRVTCWQSNWWLQVSGGWTDGRKKIYTLQQQDAVKKDDLFCRCSGSLCDHNSIRYNLKPPAPQDFLVRVSTMFNFSSRRQKSTKRTEIQTYLSRKAFWCWLFWLRIPDPCSISHTVSPQKTLPW